MRGGWVAELVWEGEELVLRLNRAEEFEAVHGGCGFLPLRWRMWRSWRTHWEPCMATARPAPGSLG